VPRRTAPASIPRVSLRQLWAFLAIALPVLAAVIAPLPSVDLAYHLRAGAEILATRAIPSVDTWTFTAAGMPWQDQQWGAQVVLAAAYQALGWTGLILVRAALVGVAFGLLFDLCRRRAGSIRVAALLGLAAFGCTAITLGLNCSTNAGVISCLGKRVTVEGGAGNDHLTVEGKLPSTIDGGDGDDWMIGGKAADIFIGGAGDDTVDYGARSGQQLNGTAGTGADDGKKSEHDDIRADVEHIVLP